MKARHHVCNFGWRGKQQWWRAFAFMSGLWVFWKHLAGYCGTQDADLGGPCVLASRPRVILVAIYTVFILLDAGECAIAWGCFLLVWLPGSV